MPNVIDLAEHRRHDEADPLQNLEAFVGQLKENSEIVELRHLTTERKARGTIHRYGFITAGGYAYNGNVTISDELASDIPVFATCAWGTSPRGHNEHTALKLMEDGLATIIVGNEGSYHPKNLPAPKTDMTMAGTAAAALRFSQVIAGEHGEFRYLLHPRLRTALGESKGGMEGMGSLWLAPFFNQELLMADYTAPCIPHKIKRSDLVEFSNQLKSEPLSIARLAGRLTLGLVLHYPATVDLHPHAIAQQVTKRTAVFSGEAGDLARLIDTQKLIHITVFKEDFASMRQVWEEIFADYPNVRITPLEGSHLTIADPETLAYIRARQQAFRDVYNAKAGVMAEISADEVFDLAHAYVAKYLRPAPQGPINRLARLIFDHSNSELKAA